MYHGAQKEIEGFLSLSHAKSVIPSPHSNDILLAEFQGLLDYESSPLLVHRIERSRFLILKQDSSSEASDKIPTAQFLIWDHPEAQLRGALPTGRWQRKQLPNQSAVAAVPANKEPL